MLLNATLLTFTFDTDVAIGADVQSRFLGDSFGMAVVNRAWINYVRSRLESVLTKSD
jgi:hypothetical protein